MVPPADDDDHDCGWKTYARAQDKKLAEQEKKLAALTEKLAEFEQRLTGKKSERRKAAKLPPPIKQVPDPADTAKKRKMAAAIRDAKLATEIVDVPVPPEQCTCPACGNTALRPVGDGKPSTVYDYVQPYFRKRIFRRQTLACRCGHIVTAPAPDRVGDKTRYAPGFVAHLIVTKCGATKPRFSSATEAAQSSSSAATGIDTRRPRSRSSPIASSDPPRNTLVSSTTLGPGSSTAPKIATRGALSLRTRRLRLLSIRLEPPAGACVGRRVWLSGRRQQPDKLACCLAQYRGFESPHLLQVPPLGLRALRGEPPKDDPRISLPWRSRALAGRLAA